MSQMNEKIDLLKELYTKLEDGSFQCMSCLPKIKVVMISDRSLFNLKRHIDRVHPSKASVYTKALARERRNTRDSDNPTAPKQMRIDSMMNTGRVTQAGLNDVIFRMVVNVGLHFTLVRDKHFLDLIQYLHPTMKPPSYSTLMKIFNEKFEKMEKSLKATFAGIDYICITCDCWTVANRSYFGMTAHYIDDELNRHSVALACTRIIGQHTCGVLGRLIEEKLKEYCIHNKCVGVVTDNAGNFVKAFKMSSLKQAEKEEEEGEEGEEEGFCDDSFHLESAGDYLDQRHTSVDEYYLPKHHRCVAHTLNLISTRDIEAAMSSTSYKKMHRSTMAKCQAVWNKQQRSSQMADEIREKCGGLSFKIPVITRWNSLHDALDKFQRFFRESGDNLDSLMDVLELERFREVEVRFISEYLDVTKPLARALDILQGEENCYAGFLLPTLHVLKKKLAKKENLTFCNPLVECLLNGINKRFAPIFDDRDYLLAAFLIPMFKDLNWLEAEETKIYIHQEIKKELLCMRNEDASRSDNEESDDDFFPQKKSSGQTSSEMINKYCSWNITGIQELRSFPEIKQLFKKYNTMIPSSASVERLFSMGGGIFRKNRHRLKDENFESQLLLKLNYKFL